MSGQALAQRIERELVAAKGGPAASTACTPRRPLARRGGAGIYVGRGSTTSWSALSRCCTPVPGDRVVGFVTRRRGVSVHREDCREHVAPRHVTPSV